MEHTMMPDPSTVTQEDREKRFESQYDMKPTIILGEGTYGKVFKARSLTTGLAVAMKYMKLGAGDEGVPSTAIREVAILKGLDHQHIVRLLDVFCSTSKLVLVFECLESDLTKFMRANSGSLSPPVIKDFSLQLTRGIEFCHSRRVIHRDLKPQNLLISSAHLLKIADFGLARAFILPIPQYTHEMATLSYRPPEILLGITVYSIPVDIWGVGCIIAEMATGTPLFPGDSEIGTAFKIFQKLGTPTEAVWPGLANLPDFKPSFPKWPARGWAHIRNTAAQVGPDGMDLLDRLMKYDPSERLSARKALSHQYFAELMDVPRSRLGGA